MIWKIPIHLFFSQSLTDGRTEIFDEMPFQTESGSPTACVKRVSLRIPDTWQENFMTVSNVRPVRKHHLDGTPSRRRDPLALLAEWERPSRAVGSVKRLVRQV